MLIFAIDDELPLLRDAERSIRKAAPDAALMTFELATDAIDAIVEQSLAPDIAFCDIEMPGLSGLEFAVRLKTLSPKTRIVFVTGYDSYAVQAFKLKVHGYLMKPLQASDVLEEIKYLPHPPEPVPDKLVVQCFGHFEVFWQGKPLRFSRSKTKELLAYLVDREGAYCTSGEIICALWEDETEISKAKTYLRVLINDLTGALNAIGMRDTLLKRRGQWAVDCDRLDCDYYRMLSGDMEAVNAYTGQYMVDYSWAEFTVARLHFRKQ